MYLFISYAREDHALAERVRSHLAAAGFECFLDTTSLPPGQEFNARIGRAIERADLFVVLLSPAALEHNSYVLTELSIAERKWPNPAGYVLPVATAPIDHRKLPSYLAPINVFQPKGNVEAAIVTWVRERAEQGGGGRDEPPYERLERWRRLHQPPLRRQRRFPARFVFVLFVAVAFIAFGLAAASFMSGSGTNPAFEVAHSAMMILPMLVGGGLAVFSVVQIIRGVTGAAPVAALVLDRNERKNAVIVHLLVQGNRRRAVTAVGRDASAVYPGEIGWAFIASGMLLGFERG